jgi:hypothetical protein
LVLSPIELAVRATGPCDDLERLDGALERGDRALERRRLEPRDALLRGRLEARDAFPRELLDGELLEARERVDLDEAARGLDELTRVGLDELARPLADEAGRRARAALRAPFLAEVDRAVPFLLVEGVLVWAIWGLLPVDVLSRFSTTPTPLLTNWRNVSATIRNSRRRHEAAV